MIRLLPVLGDWNKYFFLQLMPTNGLLPTEARIGKGQDGIASLVELEPNLPTLKSMKTTVEPMQQAGWRGGILQFLKER